MKKYTDLYTYIWPYIPKFEQLDVTGDFFLRGKRGGGDFLMAEACRTYLAWNVIFFFFF